MLTVIGLAAIVFSFYLYDIKRLEVLAKKDKVFKVYFFASLALILAAFIGSLFIVENPIEARNRRVDERIVSNFYNIESAVSSYYNTNKKLPATLDDLKKEALAVDSLIDPTTRETFGYKAVSGLDYQLCANFRTDNKNSKDVMYQYLDQNKRHLVGYQCLDFKVYIDTLKEPIPVTAPAVTPAQ